MPHDPLSRTQRIYARRLRRHQTEEEAVLWNALRSRRFAGFKFRRQHPLGPFILDFYCIDQKLAIELDGGEHSEERAAEYDRRRSSWLASKGSRELRFWNNEVKENLDGVLQTILAALTADPGAPSPQPSPAGRGGGTT